MLVCTVQIDPLQLLGTNAPLPQETSSNHNSPMECSIAHDSATASSWGNLEPSPELPGVRGCRGILSTTGSSSGEGDSALALGQH